MSGTVTGYAEIGGIVGLNYGEIINCKSDVTVVSSDDMSSMDVGGICGYNRGYIENSYYAGNIEAHGLNSGGVVGVNGEEGQVVGCFNVGNIVSDYYSAGGIGGHNVGVIEQCFNNGRITAYNTAGGIIGTNAGRVAYSYNTSSIAATDRMAGGVCGSSEGEIKNCYNAGTITAKNIKGGICGYNSPASPIERCFFSTDRFVGNITGNNESYPHCIELRDVDMAAVNTLNDEKKLGNIVDECGIIWSKRDYDESHCYYPELKCFYNTDKEDIEIFSRESARIARKTAEVRLGLISCEYDGMAHKSDVWLGQELLTECNDYICEYENNVNVGEASVKVIMTNYYIGELVDTFEITQKPIEIEWSNEELMYDGGVRYPTVTKANGLVNGDEVEFDYSVDGGIGVGRHEVTAVLAKGGINDNYYLSPQLHKYSILPRKLNVVWDDIELIYNKKAQFPTAKISGGLVNDDTVELIYSGYNRNIDAGNSYKVTVTVSANDTNYTLRETKEYGIAPKPISASFEFAVFNYTGKSQHPIIENIVGLEFGDTVVFEYFEYENNIDIGEHIVYAELSNKESGKNYRCEWLSCTYEIKQGIFDIGQIAFSSKTFVFDGTEKALYIEGELPADITVKYDGNGRIAVGKYMITANFEIAGDRYLFLEPLTAELTICPNEYFSEGVTVSVLDGNVEYGAELKIGVLETDKKFAYEKTIAAYRIEFLKDGNFALCEGRYSIKIPLDGRLIGDKKIKLYTERDGIEVAIAFEIIDNFIVFETETFGYIYITYEKSYLFILWIALGCLLLASILTVSLIFIRRKKTFVSLDCAAAVNDDIAVSGSLQVSIQASENVSEVNGNYDSDFYIDGIYCKSYDSFMASLNYKNIIRQKEICSMDSTRAISCSIGKGGNKRKDLYWQGKRILRNSEEYAALINRAKSQIGIS